MGAEAAVAASGGGGWSSSVRSRSQNLSAPFLFVGEQMLQPLSFVARDALKKLSLTPSDNERRTTAFKLPGEVRDELRAFAIRLREQELPEFRRRRKHA